MKNKDSLTKILLLTFLFLAPINLSAEIGTKKWSKLCAEAKKTCLIAIKVDVTIKSESESKKQTLGTAFIRLGSTAEKKKFPILSVNLPLNSELNKKPLVQIDKKSIANLSYKFCNNKIGCNTSVGINDKTIKTFKAGKTLNVIFGVYGAKKNMTISFPLKGFTKAYNDLTE